ncbi:MAG: hypothetical protein AB1656_06355 [Candidatus Omnitrophota bacterium]
MMKTVKWNRILAVATIVFISALSAPGEDAKPGNLWETAQKDSALIRFSTLFTAQDMRDSLSSPEGIEKAIRWCKDTAVTRVYLETFRDGYTAERPTMLQAKQKMTDAGFLVSGCVTTTGLGRKSVNGWMFPCFTDQATLDKLKSVFEYTAGLFDEIMIDDFYATKCECEDCVKARGERSWSEFRCELLADISRRCILDPARKINPNVKIIIKYPQWYEEFHERGYDVVGETEMFDKIWVGTETRDPDSQQWGRKTQYEAYFIMRWLGAIGGGKSGGGWFDPYGTSPATYLEQARQTLLAGAKEALLFCYGSLLRGNGADNILALRKELPQLFQLVEKIHGKAIYGPATVKPPNSDADGDRFVYDFVGMLGLPLVPSPTLPEDAKAAFLPFQILKDSTAADQLKKWIKEEKPLLVTSHLREKLPAALFEGAQNLQTLETPDDLWKLMDLPPERIQSIRNTLLKPYGVEFEAPSRTALYLYEGGLVVIENFNDAEIEAKLTLDSKAVPQIDLTIPESKVVLEAKPGSANIRLPGRSLMVLQFP